MERESILGKNKAVICGVSGVLMGFVRWRTQRNMSEKKQWSKKRFTVFFLTLLTLLTC